MFNYWQNLFTDAWIVKQQTKSYAMPHPTTFITHHFMPQFIRVALFTSPDANDVKGMFTSSAARRGRKEVTFVEMLSSDKSNENCQYLSKRNWWHQIFYGKLSSRKKTSRWKKLKEILDRIFFLFWLMIKTFFLFLASNFSRLEGCFEPGLKSFM